MNDDMHDDGLVHSHGWATEPPPSIGTLLRPAHDDGRNPAPANDTAAVMQDDAHDDGLVHHHGWACGERGAMGFAG
jgi:hypothetical protein